MIITKHAVDRFKERISTESDPLIRMFIEEDIKNSELLYSINGVEKRHINGIVYVIENKTPQISTVITLYLRSSF